MGLLGGTGNWKSSGLAELGPTTLMLRTVSSPLRQKCAWAAQVSDSAEQKAYCGDTSLLLQQRTTLVGRT